MMPGCCDGKRATTSKKTVPQGRPVGSRRGARLCPQDQPQRVVLFGMSVGTGKGLRLVRLHFLTDVYRYFHNLLKVGNRNGWYGGLHFVKLNGGVHFRDQTFEFSDKGFGLL